MITNTNITSLKKLFSGKVRDIYQIDEKRLLLVATDRLSAFDVVFEQGIPEKGQILTELSNFWFNWLQKHIPTLCHHLLAVSPESVVSAYEHHQVARRAMVVHRTKPLPIEAVVRGYLAGSAWKSYQETGTVCGEKLPSGLAQSAKLPTAIFTPATKAATGFHDENISFEIMIEKVGEDIAKQVRDLSLLIYKTAAKYAATKGLIIADTKFEFGIGQDCEGRNTLMLIDEVLTPDSSRYWLPKDYREGISPPSFDKQFVRDYLVTIGWNQSPPPPSLPAHITAGLTAKYQSALNLLKN